VRELNSLWRRMRPLPLREEPAYNFSACLTSSILES
jgi:hypothetical protein